TTAPGDYQPTPAGLNQAITDAENLRVQNNQGTLIQITAGAHIEIVGSTNTILAKNSGYSGSQCIVFESSNPLPAGVRVGSVQIASVSRNSNTASVTTSQTHGLKTGDVVEVKKCDRLDPELQWYFPGDGVRSAAVRLLAGRARCSWNCFFDVICRDSREHY